MKFRTDSHFLIGHTHLTGGKPCQDYAVDGTLPNSAYAIVCDGCSSGGFTDIGSSILALTTVRALKGCSRLPDKFGPGQISLVRADGIKQAGLILGLNDSDMLATCIYAYVSSENGFIHLEGDGVIAVRYLNGDTRIIRYDWADNTPFYPTYLENPSGFIRAHTDDLNAKRLTKQNWVSKPDGVFEDLGNEDFTLGEGLRGITAFFNQTELSQIGYIAIFTDGVTQIHGVDWKDAVIELLAFKTTEGQFAKRRMNRMVKDVQKKGHGPLDDISFAVIKFNHEE